MNNKKNIVPPKTHSNILWHFTGGPKWDIKENAQCKKKKSPKQAYEAFLSILNSKRLRLGGFHEVIKIMIPKLYVYNPLSKKRELRINQIQHLQTSPVCCVADIPLSELQYHSQRYGNIAIGFRRESLIKAGFNPVLYTQDTGAIVSDFYSAQRTLEILNEYDIKNELELLESSINDYIEDLDENNDFQLETDGIDFAVESLISETKTALRSLENSLAFVKTYSVTDFENIYAEREWRSTTELIFTLDNIDTVILPSRGSDFYSNFMSCNLKKTFPKSVKIIKWEDIEI